MQVLPALQWEMGTPVPSSGDIADAMDPIMRRILELPASTPAGLAVKARTTRWAYGECGEIGTNCTFTT